LTIHDVTYDGRELFYRLSLSEMFVPYGDSRSPYPRKAAFDLGNNGAGVNANNLQLGKFSKVLKFCFPPHRVLTFEKDVIVLVVSSTSLLIFTTWQEILSDFQTLFVAMK
jgi:hypothetical protein